LPHFTLQFRINDGPVVAASIGVSVPRGQALLQAGQQTPPLVPIRALIDTGASHTCVDPTVLSKLGLTPTGTAQVHTPTTGSTPQQVNQYDIALLIPGADPTHAALVRSTLPVTEHALAIQGIQALIGRDVLSDCVLIYNGTTNLFTLSY
jgi:predicted aspartyl protease